MFLSKRPCFEPVQHMHGLRSKAPLVYSNMYVTAVEIKLHEIFNVKLSCDEVLQQLSVHFMITLKE